MTNLEIQNYYQNENRFNGAYSRNNVLDKIKDGTYVTNLDEYSNIGIHWIALYPLNNNVTYFDSFVVEHIPKEILLKNSVLCGYFCIGFISFMLKGRRLTDVTNL